MTTEFETVGHEVVRLRGRDIGRWPVYHMVFFLLSAVLIANVLIALGTVNFQVQTERAVVAGVPLTRFIPQDPDSPRYDPQPLPIKAVVVIAQGFSGSQQIMWPFASTLARSQYAAVTFDFAGQGKNGAPFATDAAQRQAQLDTVVQDTRRQWPTLPIVLLGHSMGSAAVVEYAHAHPDIAGTIAVSLVAEAAPDVRNLLVLTGAWETGAIKEMGRAAIQRRTVEAVQPGVRYGDFGAGTAGEVQFVGGAEHALVIWSHTSLEQAVRWVDGITATSRTTPILTDVRLPAVGVLVLGVVWMWWSLTYFMFRRRPAAPISADLGWRRLLLISGGAGVLTPIILRFAPTDALPIAVGSYVALHFGLYGLLLMVGAAAAGVSPLPALRRLRWPATIGTALLLVGFVIIGLGVVAEFWWLNMLPPLRRVPWAVVIWTLAALYFVADAWLVSSQRSSQASWQYAATKLIFVLSLGLAIALDRGLFFILLILPILIVTFALFGVMGDRLTRRTGNPFPAALATAALIAWVIAVSFPLLS